MKRKFNVGLLAFVLAVSSAFATKVAHAPGWFGIDSNGTELQLSGDPAGSVNCPSSSQTVCAREYDQNGQLIKTDANGPYQP